jgi:DNA-binding NarL/FixJ family response regulator
VTITASCAKHSHLSFRKVDAIVRAVEVVGAGGMAFDPATSRPQDRKTADKNREPCLGALTTRETEVLRRIAAGQGTRQMASEMGVTISTLRSYVKSVLAKLGVHSRLEAAAIASNGHHRPVLDHGNQDPHRRSGTHLR